MVIDLITERLPALNVPLHAGKGAGSAMRDTKWRRRFTLRLRFKQPQGASADDGNTGKKQDDEDDGQNKE
jgi:hypothetical protein